MFTMGSSCSKQVAPQGDQCLGGQFDCALMYYVMFWTIVEVRNSRLGGPCGLLYVCFGNEKRFHVGFNIKLP